ncbi:hypothetical protein E4U54_006707, partial [Claviceps lovelessii]
AEQAWRESLVPSLSASAMMLRDSEKTHDPRLAETCTHSHTPKKKQNYARGRINLPHHQLHSAPHSGPLAARAQHISQVWMLTGKTRPALMQFPQKSKHLPLTW